MTTKISIITAAKVYEIHTRCSKCPSFAATKAWRCLGPICLFYTFHQDGASAHRAREMVSLELLIQERPDFIPQSLWLPHCQDLNPVDYTVWGMLHEQSTWRRFGL